MRDDSMLEVNEQLRDLCTKRRKLLEEAEDIMCKAASHLSRAMAGQYGNELAGDMNAWMERLNE